MNGRTKRPMKSQEHKVEIIGSIILLLVSALLPYVGVSSDVAWLAGIMSVLLGLTVAILKEHLSTTLEGLINQQLSVQAKLSKTVSLLSEMNGLPYEFGVQVMDKALHVLEQLRNGEIPLQSSEYFQRIVASMNEAPAGSVVYAVNCIDELRWVEDPREMHYLAENLEAAARGVKITRIFIVDRHRLMEPENSRRVEIIKIQVENENIEAHVVWRDTLVDENDRIKDWVFFSQPQPKLYIDYPDHVDGTRIAHAVLIVNAQIIEKYIEDFHVLMRYKVSKEHFFSHVTKANGASDEA